MRKTILKKTPFLSLAILMVVAAYGKVSKPTATQNKGVEAENHPQTAYDAWQVKSGNQKIKNFRLAKTKAREVYRGLEETFYCGCTYRNKLINHQSCGFESRHQSPRTYRVEWEHVVPAYDFGRSFPSWRNGHPQCVRKKNGRTYKGRRCARKVSPRFSQMEADLYNLVPAIGEVNERRSNLPVMNLPDEKNQYGACATKISELGIEPRDEVKGFIARTYKYMDEAYPGHGIISKKNRKLFDSWDRLFPVTSRELQRARRISLIQGNTNRFVEQSEGKIPPNDD